MSTQIVLQDQDTGNPADLYMSFELSDNKWQLTLSDGRRGPPGSTVQPRPAPRPSMKSTI